jgi:hypothetical protein
VAEKPDSGSSNEKRKKHKTAIWEDVEPVLKTRSMKLWQTCSIFLESITSLMDISMASKQNTWGIILNRLGE